MDLTASTGVATLVEESRVAAGEVTARGPSGRGSGCARLRRGVGRGVSRRRVRRGRDDVRRRRSDRVSGGRVGSRGSN